MQSLLGQTISELHLLDPDNPEMVAILAVLNTVLGKGSAESIARQGRLKKDHQVLNGSGGGTGADSHGVQKVRPEVRE